MGKLSFFSALSLLLQQKNNFLDYKKQFSHERKKEILFIGSFLSKKKGTKDVAEKIAFLLKNDGFVLRLKSQKQNKIARMFSIIFAILTFKGNTIHFDVFSGQAFKITQIGSLLAKNLNKRILFTLRGGALVEFSKKHPRRVQKVFNNASYIQTPSLFLKEHFSKQGFDIHYLPNPVDINRFSYSHGRNGLYSLLWVRAFANIYNPTLAIKTLYEVQKFFPEATLSMVGPDKGLMNYCKTLANNLKLEKKISFVGPVLNEKLFQYYQSHSVFLNTTSYESFGTAILEAAACGIPIVSTKVGEIPYLWSHGKNILMVEGGDPQSMAREVIKIFKDEKLAKLLSVNARNKAESFSWERVKPRWIEVLSD